MLRLKRRLPLGMLVKVKVPIVYAYLYSQLKKKNSEDVISTKQLKHIILISIIRNDGTCSRKGTPTNYKGNIKGIPIIYIYDIINDMRELNLIKRINHTKFKILKNNCEKQLKDFPF